MKAKSKAEKIKEYKAATTPKEMVESWAPAKGVMTDELHKMYSVYEEKAPEVSNDILKNMIQEPEIKMMERGLLDPKLVELARLMIAIQLFNTDRIPFAVVAAKTQGASDEEIMDLAWDGAYGLAKSSLLSCCSSIIEGYKISEQLQVKQKYEEGRKAGRDAFWNFVDEVKNFKDAESKPHMEMLASWNLWWGMPEPMSMAIQKQMGLNIFNEKAPNIETVKDHFHAPLSRGYKRWSEGTGLSPENKEMLEWVAVAAHRNPGAVMAHTPFLHNRGFSDEQIMEMCYLFCVEIHRNVLEKIGPALAEGFKKAAELGIK
jgi:alkylhydroperoxidase/carboxymuconolactone decarboxylase family protein YurZ